MLVRAKLFHALAGISDGSWCSVSCMDCRGCSAPEFYQYNDKGISAMPIDITITPLNRVGGQEQASLPGLMAAVPPRKAARGRDQDRLIVYLQLAGKAVLSSGDVVQAASRAAVAFYATPGTITSALRSAAEAVNHQLHSRNLASPGQGKFAVGMLALVAIRESHLTLLLSGPMKAFVLGAAGARQIADSLSGRGLGLGGSTPHYFAQLSLQVNDLILLGSSLPSAWQSALRDPSPSSLDAARRRLMVLTAEDVGAVLMQATEGDGALHLRRVAPGDHNAAGMRAAPAAPDREFSHRNVPDPERPALGYSRTPLEVQGEPPVDEETAPSAYSILRVGQRTCQRTSTRTWIKPRFRLC